MVLKINKDVETIDGSTYSNFYVTLEATFINDYDKFNVQSKCFSGFDPSLNVCIDYISIINWVEFNDMDFQYEEDASTNFDAWFFNKTVDKLTSPKTLMYEYKIYETNIYDLDPSTGDPMLDDDSNPIILHKKDDIVNKKNGAPFFYNKELPQFCETTNIEKIL